MAWTRRRLIAATCASAALPSALLASTSPRAAAITALASNRHVSALYKAEGRGLYRSDDGARSWRPLSLPPMPAGARVTSLSLSAGEQPALYVAGPRLGVLRSEADGQRWLPAHATLPSRNVSAVAAHSVRPDTVYAYIAGRGIYRSEDAGRHWRLMDAGPRGGITRFVHSDMAGSMQTGWLFATGPQGVRLSMDCFCGWRSGGELPLPARAVSYDPRSPNRILASAASGVHESGDGGQSWSAWPDPGVPVDALAFASDGALYAAGGNTLLRGKDRVWERVDA